jgi:hypothetical protein
MRRIAFVIVAAIVVSSVVGCSSTPHRTAAVTPERDAEMLGAIMDLEGTWTMPDENGEIVTGTVYRPTAGGSAVEEVMFPGTDYEMVNVYHMDGDDLVVTHYCATGNQPRMVATDPEVGADGARVYRFNCDSVANYRPGQGHYMGGLVLTIRGDELTQTWTSLDEKGEPSEPLDFVMTRK